MVLTARHVELAERGRSATGVVGRCWRRDRRRRGEWIGFGDARKRPDIDIARRGVGAAREQGADRTGLVGRRGERVIGRLLERLAEVGERVQLAPELHADEQQREDQRGSQAI